jgi:hypothetical protein
LSGQAAIAEKLSLIQYAKACFLAKPGYDSPPNLAFLDVEDSAGSGSLQEDCLPLQKGYGFPSLAACAKEYLWIEFAIVYSPWGRFHQKLFLA